MLLIVVVVGHFLIARGEKPIDEVSKIYMYVYNST